MKTVFLSLGSNLGDREQHLRDAVRSLDNEEIRVVRQSSIYETEPQDVREQPWFLNMVVEAETTLFPLQLLHRIQKIERALGRKRLVAKGPRTVDIDVLLFGNSVISSGPLEVPHPRMTERRFVLAPLAELAPDLRHPVTRRTVREMLAGLSGQSVRKSE